MDSRLSPPRKRSERETSTDYRSKVVGEIVGNSGTMRKGDVQTSGHVGIRDSRERVETRRKVVIHIERHFVERPSAGTAEISGRAGRRIAAESILPLLIPRQRDVRFLVE